MQRKYLQHGLQKSHLGFLFSFSHFQTLSSLLPSLELPAIVVGCWVLVTALILTPYFLAMFEVGTGYSVSHDLHILGAKWIFGWNKIILKTETGYYFCYPGQENEFWMINWNIRQIVVLFAMNPSLSKCFVKVACRLDNWSSRQKKSSPKVCSGKWVRLEDGASFYYCAYVLRTLGWSEKLGCLKDGDR